MVVKVLMKSGAVVRAWGVFYKAVVHMVFLYGSERWVLTGAMLTVLEGFHNRVTIRISGERHISVLGKTVGNGHQWKNP